MTRTGPVALLFVLLLATPAVAEECAECHRSPSFKVQHKALFDYYNDYQNSVHGVAGVGCTDCHGGTGDTEDLAKAHEGVLDPVRYDRIPETCGSCHAEQKDAFVTSEHFRRLESEGTAPNCVTCHGAMDMDFILASRVRNTCTFCHNQESGTLPGVPDQAEYILGKINVMKGYRTFVNTHLQDKDQAADLDGRYYELTAKWHRFDLDAIEGETKDLLGDYRKAKAEAVKDRRR